MPPSVGMSIHSNANDEVLSNGAIYCHKSGGGAGMQHAASSTQQTVPLPGTGTCAYTHYTTTGYSYECRLPAVVDATLDISAPSTRMLPSTSSRKYNYAHALAVMCVRTALGANTNTI